MAAALILGAARRAQIAAEARAAFPRECCGLIEGRIDGEAAEVLALHPTANLGAGNDRFEIDPVAHIRLLKTLRGTGRSLIGCYHSHPNGRAEPSATDRAGAAEEGFVWLIQPVTAEAAGAAAAFVWRRGGFEAVPLAPAPGDGSAGL